MKKYRFKILQKIFSIILMAIFVFTPFVYAQAETVSSLKSQQQAAAAKAAAAAAAKAAAQVQASQLNKDLSLVDSQIDQTQSSIDQTQSQISQTQGAITDLEAQIKAKEDELNSAQNKMGDVIASWYMEGESGLLEAVLASSQISDVITQQQYYDSIKQQIAGQMDRINRIKVDLNSTKTSDQQQLASLNDLKSSQQTQQNYLEGRQTMKTRLLTDTTHAITDLAAEQKAAEQQIADLQKKINTLSATQRWGDQIVSSGGGLSVPVYFQTGNQDKLGSTSYTVSLYGCFISSIAMIASYWGHTITPSEIAKDKSSFDGEGNYSPSSSLGVSVGGYQGVDWDVVDSELAAKPGRPVIISVYLPEVGKINRDGSSHFIVIKGKSGNQYLMNDPIGSGRGYNISQVRSMRIVRP